MNAAATKKKAPKQMPLMTLDRPGTVKAGDMSDRTVRLSVAVDPALHKALRQRVLDEDVSIRDFMVRLLKKELGL